jgi:hypothetical protein
MGWVSGFGVGPSSALEGAILMRLFSSCLALLFLFLLTNPANSETTVWDDVRNRMMGSTGYSLRCDYVGPEGAYFFNYVVHGAGERILTEVLEGSTRGAGTRIYYSSKHDRENVTMQTRLFRLRRSLQARDIKDSPLYKPLFSHLLDEICEAEPREVTNAKENRTVFTFGDVKSLHEYLEVDGKGNPMTLRRMMAGKQLNSMVFHQLEWGEQPLDWEE